MKTGTNRRNVLAGVMGATALGVSASAAKVTKKSNPTTTACAPSGELPLPVQPVVEIASGRLRGTESGGVRNFKGIPYAASTAGENRFMPPQSLTPWKGFRDALVYGGQCPYVLGVQSNQPMTRFKPEDAFLLYRNYTPHTSSEDCLLLNVWAPNGPGRRPVMVYMHGGGYVAGSGNDLLAYDGENLARRGDVVVVTHNHRLNIFGYLDLSSFGGRWAQSVNLGMQDIVAVLQWVRDNISAFGGDSTEKSRGTENPAAFVASIIIFSINSFIIIM